MSDTTFTAGTVIASSWLNDINDAVYTDLGGVGGLSNTSNTAKGDALIGVKRNSTGALGMTLHQRLENDFVRLEDFTGADPTGNTSSDVALTNALTASKTVVIGPGTWKFTSAPTISQDDVSIIGLNPENTFLTYTGAGTFLTFHGGFNHIEGVSLYGNGSSSGTYFTAGQVGIEIVGNLTMDRCQVRFWEKALQQTTATGFYLKFRNCQFLYNKYHGYNLTVNNTVFESCRAGYSDYVVVSGGGDGPLSWIGGSIENVTTAAFALAGGVFGSINLQGVYIENAGGTSTVGTGLSASGYKAAWLILGDWRSVCITGCNGQIAGFQRVVDTSTATTPSVVSVGNQWTYKLDAGLSDTQYIFLVGAASTVIIVDRATGRSDPSYVPSATYTITGVSIASYTRAFGSDPVSNDLLEVLTGSGKTVTETAATHTLANTTTHLVCNRAGTITVTLPSAASYTGHIVRIRTITANTVVSASSNVVPMTGGAAGTAILAATAGKWADLQSDGSNWLITGGN